MKIKQFLCLLLSLAFLIPSAHAKKKYYSIQDVYEQAKDGWHQSYEAYGRSIDIATDILVPQVQSFPVQKMELISFDSVQLVKEWDHELNMNDILFPGQFGYDTVSYNTLFNTFYDTNKIRWETYPSVVNPRELDKVYVGGEKGLTLGEVMEITKEGCEAFGIDSDGFDIAHPDLLGLENFIAKKTDEIIAGEYTFDCNQMLNGIPVYSHARGVSYSPNLRCLAISKYEFCISLNDILQTGDLVQEDVPLLGFDAIKKIIEKEITKGHIRHIYDLNLGYLLYDDEEYFDKTSYVGKQRTIVSHFYGVPAWNLRCLYLKDPHKELPNSMEQGVYPYDSMESVTISINAQTGELLHYKTSARYGDSDFIPLPDILTWDAVGGKP